MLARDNGTVYPTRYPQGGEVSFWTNPWTTGIGGTVIGGVIVAYLTRYWTTTSRKAKRSGVIESPSGGTNIAGGSIGSVHVGDIRHGDAPDQQVADQTARAAYGARRMLTRVRDAARRLTQGSLGSSLDAGGLDEVEAAVTDFKTIAHDLHLLPTPEVRDRVSAFAVRVQRELGEVRTLGKQAKDYWEKAHEEHRSGRYPLEVWLKQRRPRHTQHTTDLHLAAHHKMQGWVDESTNLLALLPPEQPTTGT